MIELQFYKQFFKNLIVKNIEESNITILIQAYISHYRVLFSSILVISKRQ